jgi:tripartite ATP-independent transporter DctM subunit
MAIIFFVFIFFLLTGAPVGFALCIPSALYVVLNDIPLSILVQRLSQSLNSFPLLAVPLFIMAGRFMNEGGITRRIFRFANNTVGFIPGGLGHVNVVSSMIFAGMSGVAIADIGGIGQIEVKAMNEAKYPIRFTAGITAASAIVGPIIPPSIPIIMYSIGSDASVLALFMGGIIPGVIIGLLLMILVYVTAVKKKFPRVPFAGFSETALSFFSAFPALMSPVLLIGGMVSGIFSPTEAAGVTVVYSLILTTIIYRDLPIRRITPVLLGLLADVAKLTFIIASALMFGWIIIVEEIPQNLVKMLLTVSSNKWVLLILMDMFFLVIGCFLEATIVFLLVTPIVVPALKVFGVNEIHFGILMVLAMGIGMYTPPMGIALYMIQDLCDISFENAVKAVIPFILPLLISLLLFTFFPGIITFIPFRLGLM